MQPVSTQRKWVSVAILAALVIAGLAIYFMDSDQTDTLVDDTDNDGKPDLWAWSDENGHMIRLERDKSHDGVADWRELFVYDQAAGKEVIVRVEADLDADGTFETTVQFEAGRMRKMERDRNQDGKVDMILHYDDPNKSPAKTLKDEDYDGTFEFTSERDQKNQAPAGKSAAP